MFHLILWKRMGNGEYEKVGEHRILALNGEDAAIHWARKLGIEPCQWRSMDGNTRPEYIFRNETREVHNG